MDVIDEINEQHKVGVENEHGLDRIKLKEERRLRNQQKKAAKKLQKQKEREQKELILKLQVKSNNVTLITRDLADKVVGNSWVTGCFSQNTSVNNADFPALGSKYKVSPEKNSHSKSTEEINAAADEKKKVSKIELADFLYMPTTSKQTKPVTQAVENYNGNPLDSDMPIRKKGKHREVPKIKKPSKLKREILKDYSEQGEEFEKPETFSLQDINLCDNIITEELNNLATTFISAIVGLQEKLYKRDSIKGKSKRRYVVGLHEVKKYLNFNKVKILIMAPDVKLIKEDGALNCVIKEIIDLAKANNVPYVFALKRRLLGVLTLKHIPVSCIAVLHYEGLEEHYNKIVQLLPFLKKEKCDTNIAEDEVNQKFLNKLMEGLKCDN